MTQLDHIKQARSMFSYANQIATLIMTKHKLGTKEFERQLTTRWQPVWDKAVDYATKHNISKHQI